MTTIPPRGSTSTVASATPKRRPRSRTRLLVLATVAVLAVVAPASAADRYDDIAPTSPHAPAIGELADAGITLGCEPGRFCPAELVQRDQMASFLSRAASRASFETNVAELSEATGFDGVPASVEVQATGAPGGTGTVTLTGVVSLWTEGDVDSCPCEVEAFVFRASDEMQGPSSWTQLPGSATGSGRTVASLPVHWTVPIPSGTTETYRIAVFLNDGEPTGLVAEGSLTAITTALP